MQDEDGNPSDKKTGKEGAHDCNDNVGKPKLFDAAFAALELLALVFWIVAEKIHGHWVVHAILLSLAGSCFLFGATHVLNKESRRPLIIWPIGVLISSIFAFVIFAFSRPEPEPQANLELVVTTSDNPNVDLRLTNDFFMFKKLPDWTARTTGESLGFVGVDGYVIVPAKSLNNLPALRLEVKNESDVVSKPVLLVFTMDNSLDVEPRGEWSAFQRATDQQNNNRSIAHKVDSISPRLADILPDIKLKMCPAISNSVPVACFVQIIPQDRSDSFVCFWLMVTISTNITQPKIVRATNGVFAVPLDIPSITAVTNWL